VATGIGGLH